VRPAQWIEAETESLGESPLWPSAAIVGAAVLYADLPKRFIAGSSAGVFSVVRWVVPGLTALVLVALVVSVPGGRLVQRLGWHGRQLRVTRRWLSLAAIAVVSAANAASIILLVHLLVNGAHTQANLLLKAGIHLWITNVLVFALWFWELDGGGPLARRLHPTYAPDFLFPQQLLDVPELRWQPTFIDYLYVAFTNATAFSPTDAMPLTKWAKVLMMVQSAASLLLAIMVVARAVNILQ
jgi:hypothetical protein